MRRDGVRRLRVHARSMSTRAASGLPPGSLGVPARSWLTTWVLRYRAMPLPESGARCRTDAATGAPRGARRGPQGSRSHRICAFRRAIPPRMGKRRVGNGLSVAHAERTVDTLRFAHPTEQSPDAETHRGNRVARRGKHGQGAEIHLLLCRKRGGMFSQLA